VEKDVDQANKEVEKVGEPAKEAESVSTEIQNAIAK